MSGGQESPVPDTVGRQYQWDLTDRGIYAIDHNVKPLELCREYIISRMPEINRDTTAGIDVPQQRFWAKR